MNKSSIAPYGGVLKDLILSPEAAEDLKKESGSFPAVTLSQRQLCDLELLINGAMSPLEGFMGQADYESVVNECALADGTMWPIPIVFDVTASVAEGLETGTRIALQDGEGFMLAVLTVGDVWQPDKNREAERVYGTGSHDHPGVEYLHSKVNEFYVGGSVQAVQGISHFEFEELWLTPARLRRHFKETGWRRVVAFQTTRPMHRLEHEIALRAAKDVQAHILMHPAVGMTRPGDLHYYGRVHCYQAVQRHFPHNISTLSLLPLAMRMAGPREALWHAIVQQNYGCTHIIIGPSYADPCSQDSTETKMYGKYAAQEFFKDNAEQLDIEMYAVEELRYVPRRDRYLPESEISTQGEASIVLSSADIKQRLHAGDEIPDWFSFPEVISEMQRVCPPKYKQGITLFFTGLSGAGKSTLARIIYARLIEAGGRPVTLLDGDVVRLNLSSELGFSKEHRDLNVRRIGFVASEITKNGGIAICAPIAPYTASRRAVRETIAPVGSFIEIHIATPLDVCESRDRKGLYAKARKGIIPEFTGISDPYEVPETPELRIDTSELNPMEAAQEIFLYLFREGYLDDGASVKPA